jgi:hypothetical protein
LTLFVKQRGMTLHHLNSVPVSCSSSAPPHHSVIWRGPLGYVPWRQKLHDPVGFILLPSNSR